jgi:enamine deaminase RidA (YjgF/YER057c/UK114 family)
MQVLQPKGWKQPRGFSHGIAAEGRQVFVAGQIGWDAQQTLADDFAAQVRQALANTVAVLAEAGAKPEHITRMTWYVTDKRDYIAAGREVGKAYQEIIGKSYPAMTLVEVKSLLEDRAKVEIESTAVVPAGK